MTTQLTSSRNAQNKDGVLKVQRMAMTHTDMETGDGDSEHPRHRRRRSRPSLTRWKPPGLKWREEEPREWLLLVLRLRLSSPLPGMTSLSLSEKSGTLSKPTSIP